MIQKINYADKQTGGKFSASDANEIKSTVNSNADVLSENSQSILSLQGGSLGSIKPTDAAPTPARNGNYVFAIGGAKPAWLTAEAGITTVKAGDGVAVVYYGASAYTYTHVDVSSDFVTLQKLAELGYMFKGIATPSTYPGTPDGLEYYFAYEEGDYPNFSSLKVHNGLSMLIYNSGWTIQKLIPQGLELIEEDLVLNLGDVTSVGNFAISSDGGGIALDPRFAIKTANVKEGDVLRLKTNMPGSGANLKRAYGFYSALPISSGTFISGGSATVNAIELDELVTTPSGATIVAVSAYNDTYLIGIKNLSPLNKRDVSENGLTKSESKIVTDSQVMDVTSKIGLISYAGNAVIAEDGGGLAVGGFSILTESVEEGETYIVKANLVYTGSTNRRAYGFYSKLPISSTNFISGSTATTSALTTNESVTIPSGATIIAISVQDTIGGTLYKTGFKILETIKNSKSYVVNKYKSLYELQGKFISNNAVIGDTGAGTGLGGFCIKYIECSEGDVFDAKLSMVSTGAIKRLYGFYSALSISSGTFISGGEASTSSLSIDEEITAPSGATILAYSIQKSAIQNSKIFTTDYTRENIYIKGIEKISLPPFSEKHERIYADTASIQGISGDNIPWNLLSLVSPEDYTVSKSINFLGDLYSITYNSGDIPFNTPVLVLSDYTTEDIFSFWVNIKDLNSNSILLDNNTIPVSQLKKGYVNAYFLVMEVVEKISDWVNIQIMFPSGAGINTCTIQVVGSNSVTKIQIANPKLLKTRLRVDPFEISKSKWESKDSTLIGKNVCLFGDSQLNFVHLKYVHETTGCIIKDFQEGGRAIKYRTGYSEYYDLNWLYHWSRLQFLKDLNPEVFVFHLSTNDGPGGGILDESSIQSVIDNYPTINDDESTVNAKLALFSAMDESTRTSIFTFKAVYGALIRQIIEWKPEARIILCTIPFSRGVNTTYETIRNNRTTALSIRDEILEIGGFFNSPVIDLYNLVNLMPENALEYESDGAHWGSIISKRIGRVVGSELIKLVD